MSLLLWCGLFGKLSAFLSVDPVLCTLKVLFYYFTSSVPTLRSQFVNNDSVVLNGKFMSFYEICKIQLKKIAGCIVLFVMHLLTQEFASSYQINCSK